jgi:HEXXH motif-containing protein
LAINNLPESFSIVQDIWPEAAVEIANTNVCISWFQDEKKLSYSNPQLFGIIFINSKLYELNSISLATLLIHETAHHALFVETSIDKLIDDDYTRLVFSPFRGESRPIIASLHALVAMSRMLLWSNKILTNGLTYKKESDAIKTKVLPKYKQAIHEMDGIKFSVRGQALMKELKGIHVD